MILELARTLGPKTCQNNGVWTAKWYHHTDARAQQKIPKVFFSAHEVFFEQFICLGFEHYVMHRAKP